MWAQWLIFFFILLIGSSSSDPAVLESWCDSSVVFPSQPTVYYTTGNVAYVTLTTSTESIADRHGFQLNFRQNSTGVEKRLGACKMEYRNINTFCSFKLIPKKYIVFLAFSRPIQKDFVTLNF